MRERVPVFHKQIKGARLDQALWRKNPHVLSTAAYLQFGRALFQSGQLFSPLPQPPHVVAQNGLRAGRAAIDLQWQVQG